ncbi:MAG: glycosyltransferase family 2 protein [Bacteroidetes bacterium]|nr:glycosyltransferase family 2 protein [Bacteroidota bacterium]
MISALVICRNEEKNIEDCLKSLSWTDEIVVIDAESSDETMNIALRYTKHVYEKKWEGFSEQRKFGISHAKGDWILSVDADERCTPELKEEILNLTGSTQHDGFLIPRKNFFLNKWVRRAGWYPNYQMKLFRKNSVSVSDRKVHENHSVKGSTGKLRNPLLHFTVRSITEYADRINSYSTLSASEKVKDIKVSFLYLIFRPYFDFIQKYIFQFGFLDGIIGLMVSFFHFYTKLLLYMKIWELQNQRNK